MNPRYKILIVGAYSFEGSSATSITLNNMLGFIEHDRIAFIFTKETASSSQYSYKTVCPKYFSKISNNSVIQNLSKERSLVAGSMGTIENRSIKKTILNSLHTIGSSYRMLLPYDYTDEVDNFIAEFRPDYIYSLLGNVAIINLCIKISSRFNIPIIPHFMDDWIHTMYRNNVTLSIAKHILKSSLTDMFKRVHFGFTISEKMAKEYRNHFNVAFFPFMNCINADKASATPTMSAGKKIQILYSGGLHLNRILSMSFFCKLLSQISSLEFELNIYTSSDNWNKYGAQLTAFPFVRYRGFISQNEMLIQQKKADVLLHIESFDCKIKNYTRLSISTKIPEYLSAKKLIIAIGPSDIASIEYLANNQAALILSDLNHDEATIKLSEILNDQNSINQLCANAYTVFMNYHTTQKQHNMIESLFTYGGNLS